MEFEFVLVDMQDKEEREKFLNETLSQENVVLRLKAILEHYMDLGHYLDALFLLDDIMKQPYSGAFIFWWPIIFLDYMEALFGVVYGDFEEKENNPNGFSKEFLEILERVGIENVKAELSLAEILLQEGLELPFAFYLFERASIRNNVHGFEGLARCYYFAYGVEKDEYKAMEYWMVAAKEGDKRSIESLREYFDMEV